MIYEIRSMSLAEILDTGFQLVRHRFALLVSICAIIYIPLATAMGLTQGVFEAAVAGSEAVGGDPFDEATPGLIGLMALYGVAMALGFPFVMATVTSAIADLYLGRTVSLGSALRAGLKRFFPLLLSYLLLGLLTFVLATLAILVAVVALGGLESAIGDLSVLIAMPLILLAIVGFYAYLLPVMAVLPQVVVFERISGSTAIRRAFRLVHGHRSRAVGVIVTATLLVFIPVTGMQLFAAFLPVLGGAVTGAAQAVGLAFTSATQVVLYFDIRCRKEAFDLEHLADLVRETRAISSEPIL